MYLLTSEYENEKQVGENFIDCEKGKTPEQLQKVCRFNVDTLGGLCTWQRDYGYDEGKPCVILKINKVT
jgi:sodium/potassium-transporting ATPase subunit beta